MSWPVLEKASLIVTMGLGLLFLGERVSWRAGVGVLLIVGGSVLVSTEPR